MAMVIMSVSLSKPLLSLRNEQDYIRVLADLFRRSGWQVKANPSIGPREADMLISRDGYRYVVELKVSSEGRRDRLVPLLAQAILQAKSFALAYGKPAAPLAVIAAPAISANAAKSLQDFLADVAPDVAAGFLDLEGFRYFAGPGLEKLNGSPPRRLRLQKRPLPQSGSLFSDLNQWMLKVLLAPQLPEELLSAPRAHYRNASELSEAASVSSISGFRLVRQLRYEGFLDSESDLLRLVRLPELLQRWQAVYLRSAPELALRWILPGNDKGRLPAALLAYMERCRSKSKATPRACLALFAAAESLGVGFVHGVPPYLYLERIDLAALQRVGLSSESAQHAPDIYVRIPEFRESVFRGVVQRNGVPVADILQVWLDVNSHPSRGAAQAEEISRRVFGSILGRKPNGR